MVGTKTLPEDSHKR